MPKFIPLPFSLSSYGGSIRITQGFGGSTSHTSYLNNSLDLAVSFNTPLKALGTGRVVYVWERTTAGALGPSNMGNVITIHYLDLGVYVTYAHLRYNSVVPEIGQSVTAGQVVAYVGDTGLIDGPHAHVQYGTSTITFQSGIVVANGSHSLPIGFDTATGELLKGVVSEVTYDLNKSGGGSNLSLIGDSNVTGYGDRSANILSGNRGKNTLDGREGNDSIFGGEGRDQLLGGAGDDQLSGGDDDDKLIGGAGSDRLSGGKGADTFVFQTGDSGKTSSTRDTILDFSSKNDDQIDLSSLDANSTKSGDQAFTYISSQAFHGKAGELALHNGILEGDTNGDKVADFQISLVGVTSLQSSDFIL